MKKSKSCVKKNIVIISLFLLLSAASAVFITLPSVALASSEQNEDLEQQISANVDNQIDSIDFSGLNNLVKNLTDEGQGLFSSGNFEQTISSILSGEYSLGFDSAINAILSLLLGGVKSFIPLLVMVVGIAVLCSVTSALKSTSSQKGTADIVHFVCYGAVIILVLGVGANLISVCANAISSVKMQMDVIFPILLTIMTAMGSIVSVGIYQPAVLMLSNAVVQVFNYVLLPLFSICLIFSVVGGLSKNIKLGQFNSFFTSCFKWIVGIVFTVFFAFLTIQGISAGVQDGISLKAARLTIKSYVPILGGYLSDGLDLVLASSALVKNAVGIGGMVLLFATILVPVVQVMLFTLVLKLASAIIEPINDGRIHKFLANISKNFTMLIAIVLGVAFMYFVTIGLMVATANVF